MIASEFGIHLSKGTGVATQIFRGSIGDVQIIVTSVVGHFMSFRYPEEFSKKKNWRSLNYKAMTDSEPVFAVGDNKMNKNVAGQLAALGKDADVLMIATDNDAEGEFIGHEIVLAAVVGHEVIAAIGGETPRLDVRRMVFSDVSQASLSKAYRNAMEGLRTPLVDRAFARSKSDFLIGTFFTRFITSAVQQRVRTRLLLSYGPCQTPVVYLVYEKEMEIRDFEPEQFWFVQAAIDVNEETVLNVKWDRGNCMDESEVKSFLGKSGLGPHEAVVAKFETKETQIRRPVPLNTEQMQQDLNRVYSFPVAMSLSLAESLYTAGLISYPRTETNVYPPPVIEHVVGLFEKLPSYFPDIAAAFENLGLQKPSSGKSKSGDHEPIHPIRLASKAEVTRLLGRSPSASQVEKAWQVYDYIVRRFFATFHENGLMAESQAVFVICGEPFTAKGKIVIKEAFLRFYPWGKPKDVLLPILAEGQHFNSMLSEGTGKTKPPKAYTEGTLLARMSKLGIGTDATAANHIQTVLERTFVRRQGKAVRLAEVGEGLISALKPTSESLISPMVRAKMEDMVNRVEKQELGIEDAVIWAREQMKLNLGHLTRDSSWTDVLVERIKGLGSPDAGGGGRGSKASDAAFFKGKRRMGGCGVDGCDGCLRMLKSKAGGRYLKCDKCGATHPLPKKRKLTVTEHNCVICGEPAIRAETYTFCPRCWADKSRNKAYTMDTEGDKFMPCFRCNAPSCRLSPSYRSGAK